MKPIKKAIILSGGFDLPLLQEFEDLHRSLLPVANIPLIYYSISNLIHHGTEEVFISCDSQRERYFREALQSMEKRIRIHYISEPFPLGTAGTLSNTAEYLLDEPFWVLNGGLITDLDLSKIAKYHYQQKASATIVANRLEFPSEGISLDETGYVEKIYLFHKSRDRRRAYLPSGIYLFNPETLKYIDAKGYFDLKEQFIPRLHNSGLLISIYELNGDGYIKQVQSLSDFYDINWQVVEKRLFNGFFSSGEVSAKKVFVGEGVVISPSASLIGPMVIGKGVYIGERCQIVGPAVIGDNVKIEADSLIRESIILSGSEVPEKSSIEYMIWSKEGETYSVRRNGHLQNNKPNGHTGNGSILPKPKVTFFSVLKRLIDISLSSIGLILLWPIFLLVSIAIRLDSPGPIFYTQRRCGLSGSEFGMIKFRTMVSNAEKLQQELWKQKDVDGPVFKMKYDPRITRVGRFLRRTSLDELPQLWNVFKGEMSLIGPRPLIMDEMRFNPRWRDIRLTVKPGITGLWQINGRGENSFHEWIEHDITYVMNQRISMDLKILFATIGKTLWRIGAH